MRNALLTPEADDISAAAGLPEGWAVLGRCRFGTAGPTARASGCHALAHPRHGVALIDIAPDATPNAEARLRRALGAVGFWSAFPGHLPVWHGRIEGADLPDLGRVLQEGLAILPPLSLAGGPIWVVALRHALAEDPAWEAAGPPPRPGTALVPTEAPDDAMPIRPQQPRRRGPLLFLGFVASFWLGLAAGLYLISEQEGIGGPAALVPPAATLVITETAAAQPPTAAPGPIPVQAVPAQPTSTVLVEQAMASSSVAPARASDPVTELMLVPESSGPVGGARPVASRGGAAQGTTRTAVIDRACSQALFRFQQGEALLPAERVYLREGCATRR